MTGAAGFLGQALVPALARHHEVRAHDLEAADGPPPIASADVLDCGDMEALCSGVDAVVHLACARWDDALSDADNETRILDTRLKGTNHLLRAAAEAGIRRVVQISDLCVFSGYADDIIVSEDFAPLPDSSAHQQSVYLSELVGREFARLHPGLVATLRLGQLVRAQQLPPGAAFDESWLDVDDAIAAILRALELESFDGISQWGIYNLAADVPDSRYSLLKISTGTFAFTPSQDFRAWREQT